MKHLTGFILTISGLLLLAACGQQPANQALPTIMPTDANVAPATATPPSTVAPTQVPLERPTLPPTWTASPGPTIAPTATTDANAQVGVGQATLAVCGAFAVDREHSMSTYTTGSPVQVFWTPVDTAGSYRIALLDENGTEVLVDYVVEPSYTFAADLFERGKLYAWSVIPLDANKVQMCFERGDEIIPR